MDLTIAVLSKQGGRQLNEDACGYWTSERACCCVVSDGLGGYQGGQIASQAVVSTILAEFSERPGISPDVLSNLLAHANQSLLEKKRGTPLLAEMRATVVLLAIDFTRGQTNWAHLGDSRLYVFRQGHILHRTVDHSYLQNMVTLGHLEESQLREHPMRNLLLGALGSTDEYTPSIQSTPRSVLNGDTFLLCTDGFWQMLDETDMARTLATAASVEDWLAAMETLLLMRVQAGHDNYSALAIWLRSPPQRGDGADADASGDCTLA